MKNILVVSDQEYSKVSFVKEQVVALRSAGYRVGTLFRIPSNCNLSRRTLYAGFSEAPKITCTHYLWYFLFKAITLISPRYKNFIDAYADWSSVGRLMGAARALRWMQIVRNVRGFGPDLIHVHFAWNLPSAIPLARFLDIPIVCTVHGSDIYLRDEWDHHLRNPIVKRVVCVSDSMQAFIHRQCPDLAEKTVRVFNPISATFLQDIVHPPDRMRIIMIAAFRTLKNHAWLLRSLRMLNDRKIDFECLLVGVSVPWEPEVLDETRSMTERLGLSKIITISGWLPPLTVIREIDQSTVLALTSTSEGLPMVVVEALARQRMPVVTDLPAMRDATGRGHYGLLVPLNDETRLADALVDAHEETVRQTQRIRSGREFVLRNFHPEVHLGEIEKVYKAALMK